jgi:hypothetical protein
MILTGNGKKSQVSSDTHIGAKFATLNLDLHLDPVWQTVQPIHSLLEFP